MSENVKHTPGPWSLHPQASTAVVGARGYVVATCGGHSDNRRDPAELEAELQSNARLIAAAPDLLALAEACEAASGRMLESGNVVVAGVNFAALRAGALAAIARATGATP